MARRMVISLVSGLTVIGIMGILNPARGDDPPTSVATIDSEFSAELAKLEKARLERLVKLAASSTGAEADRAYEACFRAAIDSNLYAEAQAAAQAAMKAEGLNPRVALLAHLVNLVAQANRGEYEQSLASLEAAIQSPPQDRKALPVAMKLSLIDAYYQKLVQSGQFEIAGKALRAVEQKAQDPAIQDLVRRRLTQVEMVGKVAPAIEGTDIDGKPYRLADTKGNVVLVVFWATWCLPNTQEIAALDELYALYRDKGMRIVGINLDAFQNDGQPVESVVADVKRFLIDQNVRWPNLIERPGDRDLAKAYGVTDIPSNVLIGKDGKIARIDLTASNLKKVIAQELGR